MIRWTATIEYATEAGPVDVTHDLEEIADLHDLVERGPHWDTIERIVIVRSGKVEAGLTVEKARAL